jgi:predicted Zn-dependent peptidase
VEFLSHALPNGLEVIAECNEEAHSAAVGFFVRTGARDENDEIAGASHFLEHMMFKGTPTRTAHDVNREFDEMGAHYNAFTNEENTVYYAAVLPGHVDRVVGLWSDLLRPSLREDDFQTEKQVILEEIRMYEDQPPFGADEKCRALHFRDHPLGRSVLGTIESITALRSEQMRDYFRRRYGPGNIVLVAAGRIDFDALVASAGRHCGAWEPVAASRPTPPAAGHDGFHVLEKASATQEYLLQLADAPSATDTLRFAAKLLSVVLGDDMGSRLYWELVDPGLAEHASLSHGEYDGAGVWMASMGCQPDRLADDFQVMRKVFAEAESGGITPEELGTAKSKVRSRIVLHAERPRGRLFTIGSDWIYRHEYCTVERDLDDVASVRLDDTATVLERFPLSRGTTVTIGPLAEVALKEQR